MSNLIGRHAAGGGLGGEPSQPVRLTMRVAMHINHTRKAMYPSMKNCTYMVYAMYFQCSRSRVRMNRPTNCAIQQNAQSRDERGR